MRRSPFPFSPSTGRGWGAGKEKGAVVEAHDLLGWAVASPGAKVTFEQKHFVYSVDAVDLLQELGYRGGVQVGVPWPSLTVRPTREGVHPLVEELESVRTDSGQCIVAGRRQGMKVGGHGHALIIRRRYFHGYPEQPARLEVLGNVVDEPVSEGKIVDVLALWYAAHLWHYQQAHWPPGGAWPEATSPGHLCGRFGGEALEVARSDRPLARPEAEWAAFFGLAHRLGICSALGRGNVRDAVDESDGRAQAGEHPGAHVALGAASMTVRPHDYLGPDRRYCAMLVPRPVGVPD